jgi:hypothetical protein
MIASRLELWMSPLILTRRKLALQTLFEQIPLASFKLPSQQCAPIEHGRGVLAMLSVEEVAGHI